MSEAWKKRSVFVTGATGLLGSWLTAALVERGAHVTCLIRDNVPASNLYLSGVAAKVNAVRGCLEDADLLERAVNEYEVDTVFHLGAQTLVGIANRNPVSTFEANIKGTWNVMEAVRRNTGVRRVIVASSDKAYGEHEVLPYFEDAPLQGRHPYDVSKSCADLISSSYFHTYKLPVCITRCGNLFGGGDLNFNRLVPGTIRSVVNGEVPVIRSDGSFIRDYFFVCDAVEAYLHLAEAMEANPQVIGHAFNFSNESQVSVLQLVSLILKLMGRDDIQPAVLNQATGEIRHQYLSAAKAQRMLNWKPAFGLEEGLRATIAWYKQFLGVA